MVVGGDAAGMSAASQARRMNPDLEIIAFERGDHVSYSACGEPYLVGGLVESIEPLLVRTPSEFAAMDIEVRLRHHVEMIDVDRRRVQVRALEDGTMSEVGFDQLMYATGSRPARPDYIDGINLPGVAGLRTLNDAVALRDSLDEGVKHVLILGGGYIGLEVAEALIGRGVEVTMVTSGDHVLERTLDDRMGELANRGTRKIGVDLHTGIFVRCIRGTDRAVGIGCEQMDFAGDLIVIGLGAVPDVGLAERSGIPLGVTGAVAVDDHQRTALAGIWSAGDCAEATHRISGLQVNVHLGTVANKAGRIAGINIGGGDASFPGVLGTAITKIGGTEIARTGLKIEEARQAGFDPVVGFARGTTAAGYWPEAESMAMLLISDRERGLILGAQIVGGRGAGKKIDVLATAMWSGVTAAELAWVDLAYAPPFSGVWDLIHVAARRATQN